MKQDILTTSLVRRNVCFLVQHSILNQSLLISVGMEKDVKMRQKRKIRQKDVITRLKVSNVHVRQKLNHQCINEFIPSLQLSMPLVIYISYIIIIQQYQLILLYLVKGQLFVLLQKICFLLFNLLDLNWFLNILCSQNRVLVHTVLGIVGCILKRRCRAGLVAVL
ncbi:Hypothetical_protein [Hexamita inflata]|uniref:Hypothetical_protein n=1 Tax=Hexamita inflata TaxID=28002 RepID=A0AA86TVN9_9EUKA|nr:Hypothetical protein HINF_LOCUS17866 [Hexamita inflata]